MVPIDPGYAEPLPAYNGGGLPPLPAAPPLSPLPGLGGLFGQQQFGPNPGVPRPSGRPNLAGGTFPQFFPGKRSLGKDNLNIAERIVEKIKAPFQTESPDSLSNREFQRITLFPQQRDETNNNVYDFTEPDMRHYEKKEQKKHLKKPDNFLVAEKPPLSSEVLKAGNVEKVNLDEVEADIKKAILAIEEEKLRAEQLLKLHPPRSNKQGFVSTKDKHQKRQQKKHKKPSNALQPPPPRGQPQVFKPVPNNRWKVPDKIPKPPVPPPSFWGKIPKLL